METLFFQTIVQMENNSRTELWRHQTQRKSSKREQSVVSKVTEGRQNIDYLDFSLISPLGLPR